MKKPIYLILTLTILIFSFTACEKNDNASTNALPEQPAPSANAADMFTNRDKKTSYDSDAVRIQLNKTSATATSDRVQISGSTVTITEEDTYLLSGELEDGCIVINADSSAKIHLVLDNVTIHNNTSAAILVLSADKVTITLAEGQSSLSNGGSFTPVDTVNVDAVLYSKDDLSLNGSGSLTIASPAGHGISCKDDLVLAGGTYTITAANHGLDANDSIRLTASAIAIEAGKDGMHAENSDDATLGFIYIADGTYNIHAQDDGIHASATLTIVDGDITIAESYEGLEALDLIINGGNIRLIASDDGLNAAGSNDGSGFDGSKGGIFDDPAAHKNNRDFSDFPESPESFESIPSEAKPDRNMQNRPDKGFGGGFGNNFGGGFGGGEFGGMGTSNGSISITGGDLYIQASGDGIDANGSLTITGGNITICGPNRGDTASLDYDTTANISGATFIATGASGMAQTLSSTKQGVLTINVGNQNAGTTLTLTDAKGNLLLTQTPELPYSLVILSSPELESGESYTLTIGTTTKTITAQ